MLPLSIFSVNLLSDNLLLMAEGYAAWYRGAAAFDFQAVMEDFEKNIAILRKNFYKPKIRNYHPIHD